MRRKKTKNARYEWLMLNNRDISDKYTTTLRNNFDAIQEISETLTSYDEYENFVNGPNKSGGRMHTNQTKSKTWSPLGDISR